MSKSVLISLSKAQHVRVFSSELYFTMPAIEPGSGVSIFDEFDPPRSGPPLHLHHHEDEILRVIEGRHRIRVGLDDLVVGPGDTIFLPRGVPHTYANFAEHTGHVIFIVQPGGLERYFQELAKASQLGRAEETKVRAKYGVEYIGPNPFTER